MGLLDGITEDQILGGLLGAGAASGAKGNFLARMAAGIGEGQKFGAWREQKARQRSQEERDAEWRQLQILKTKQDMDLAAKGAAKKDELSGMIKSLFAGAGGDPGMSPGAYSPSSDGMGPTMPAPRQGFSNASIDQIVALKALGGPDLVDAHKYANDPLKLESGSTYKNRTTGEERYLPKIPEGMIPDGRGGYRFAPGVMEGNVAAKGAEAGAVAAANAGMDIIEVPLDNGQTVRVPRADAVKRLSGGGYNGGSRDDANAESIRIMQSELQNPNLNAADRAGITREIARLQGASPPKFGVTQSPIDAIKEKAKAEAEAKESASNAKDAKVGNRLTAAADRAIQLLGQGPTESGIGTAVDKTASMFGVTPKGAEIADQLRTLSSWMVSNVPRMEGPQSNFDVANYQTMAGIVGDSTVPTPRRVAAAMEVKRLQAKYAELNQGGAPTDAAPGQTVKPPQQAINMLKMKPSLRAQFDAKYGAGAADQALRK